MLQKQFFFSFITIVLILSSTILSSPSNQEFNFSSEFSTDRYQILDTWRESYRIGMEIQTAVKYKLYDRYEDTMFIVTCNENDTNVDSKAEELVSKATTQSKLHPSLVKRFYQQNPKDKNSAEVQSENMDVQIVHVWLVDSTESNVVSLSSVSGAIVNHNENEPAKFKTALEMQAAVRTEEEKARDVRKTVSNHFQGIVQNFIETEDIPVSKIVYIYKYAPAIVLRLTYSECVELETSSLVNYLFPEEEFKVELDNSSFAMRTPSISTLGYDGSGVIIADIEPGKMVVSNPYLTATSYRSVDNYSSHSTAIGGIICGTHNNFSGIAGGCNLLNANAASYTGADIIAATEWAMSEGASVLNMSLGLKDSNDGEFSWSDIYFDYLVHYNHILFVKSAGNLGADPCESNRIITSPGRGYNSLTVGSIDSQQTVSWADDTMSPFSSYLNPISSTDKPEIVTYGSNIDSTLNESPWIGNVGSGTSFSAPMVAGIAGLIINRDPNLISWPEIVKAKIMVSGLAHNIEGDACLSEKDGAGAALATAAFAGGAGRVLSESSFNMDNFFELDMDIPFYANEPMRIVLVYTHPPSSSTALPNPESYLKSDLDLFFYDGENQVASSTFFSLCCSISLLVKDTPTRSEPARRALGRPITSVKSA